MSTRVFGEILVIAFLGSVVAGGYGILHDQFTYTLSPEYFTKFKIHQFHYLSTDSGMRWAVAKIGFLATWWVGLFAGWLFGRLLVPRRGLSGALAPSLQGFVVVFIGALVGGLSGYLVGREMPKGWDSIRIHCAELGVDDVSGFVQVACIHSGGYLGALMGLLVSLFWIVKKSRNPW